MVSIVLFSSFGHPFCNLYNYVEKPKDVFDKLEAKIPENEIIAR